MSGDRAAGQEGGAGSAAGGGAGPDAAARAPLLFRGTRANSQKHG